MTLFRYFLVVYWWPWSIRIGSETSNIFKLLTPFTQESSDLDTISYHIFKPKYFFLLLFNLKNINLITVTAASCVQCSTKQLYSAASCFPASVVTMSAVADITLVFSPKSHVFSAVLLERSTFKGIIWQFAA